MDDVSGAKQMTDLIKQVGGIEKLKLIVKNAPDWAVSVNINNGMYYELREYKRGDIWLMDIRKLISDHDRTDFCSNFENGLSPSTTVINK